MEPSDERLLPVVRIPRLHFGLKSLFVLLTIASLWFGYRAARERRANAMIDRHNAVLNTIVKNINPPPADTFYRLNPGSQDELLNRLAGPGDHHARATILRTGSNAFVTIQNLTLDISRLSEADVRMQLLNHYSQGLESLELQRTITDAVGPNSTAVWVSNGNELTVVVDVNIATDTSTAEVRLLLIDSQTLKLW
jgi:hypothetical protein